MSSKKEIFEEIKDSIEMQFPNLKEEEIDLKAKELTKKYIAEKRKVKYDEKGRKIIAENVRVLFNSPIEVMT